LGKRQEQERRQNINFTTTTTTTPAATDDQFLDQKLDLITAGTKPFLKQHLLTKISRENCSTIISYIMAIQTETNVSEHYRFDNIH
jgi:hypothetical protein